MPCKLVFIYMEIVRKFMFTFTCYTQRNVFTKNNKMQSSCSWLNILFFRWNPFARKSRGILGVIKGKVISGNNLLMADFWNLRFISSHSEPTSFSNWTLTAQTKKNRVVSKHGRINVHRKTEHNENQHRWDDIFFSKIHIL